MTQRIRVLPTLEALAAQAAVFVAETIREACAQNGVCALVLAGGSTPAPVYRLLAEERVPWSRVRVFLGDERCVPRDSPDSNARMIRETLLDSIPEGAPGERELPEFVEVFPRGDGTAEKAEEAAHGYARALPASFDLMLLGIGEDGHTASLFPGSPALAAEERVVVTEGPKPPNPRISVTPPVIRAAREIAVLAAGEGKAEAIAKALRAGCDPTLVPAALAAHGIWFIDRDAARLVGGGAR